MASKKSFKLKIELTNSAMLSNQQLITALEDTIIRLKLNSSMLDEPQVGETGLIKDLNGNTVGDWKVTR